MVTPGDDLRGLASMLADRADHESVTVDRLAGTGDSVADLRTAPVELLASGEHPEFCLTCHDAGVGLGDPGATLSPERGGVYLFTDRRVAILLGIGDDKVLSLPYGEVSAVRYAAGRRRHRIDLSGTGTTYYLRISGAADTDSVAAAAEYATYRRKAETPDVRTSADTSDSTQTVRERLERLGDAKSRGLIDEEEFQRRKEQLLEE